MTDRYAKQHKQKISTKLLISLSLVDSIITNPVIKVS